MEIQFFCQRHALLISFDIFIVTYTYGVTNFLPKLVNMLLFSTEKTEFPFLVFPYFRVNALRPYIYPPFYPLRMRSVVWPSTHSRLVGPSGSEHFAIAETAKNQTWYMGTTLPRNTQKVGWNDQNLNACLNCAFPRKRVLISQPSGGGSYIGPFSLREARCSTDTGRSCWLVAQWIDGRIQQADIRWFIWFAQWTSARLCMRPDYPAQCQQSLGDHNGSLFASPVSRCGFRILIRGVQINTHKNDVLSLGNPSPISPSAFCFHWKEHGDNKNVLEVKRVSSFAPLFPVVFFFSCRKVDYLRLKAVLWVRKSDFGALFLRPLLVALPFLFYQRTKGKSRWGLMGTAHKSLVRYQRSPMQCNLLQEHLRLDCPGILIATLASVACELGAHPLEWG